MSILRLLLAALFVANGVWMLAAPEAWFVRIPGAAASGAFNAHFVRDVGAAYTIAGAALGWRAFDPQRAWPAALAGALFLLAHAVLHAADALGGHGHGGLVEDVIAIHLPALLATWLALPERATRVRRARPGAGLLARILHRQIDAFEQRYGYDAGYMHQIATLDQRAALRFAAVSALAAARGSVPAQAWYGAKIATSLREDCGPCAQLAVTMAEQDGVPRSTIAAIVGGDPQAMGAEAALGYRFALAVIDRSADAAALRADIVGRWGEHGLLALALSIPATRMFPLVRHALGHGQACTRLRIGAVETRPGGRGLATSGAPA